MSSIASVLVSGNLSHNVFTTLHNVFLPVIFYQASAMLETVVMEHNFVVLYCIARTCLYNLVFISTLWWCKVPAMNWLINSCLLVRSKRVTVVFLVNAHPKSGSSYCKSKWHTMVYTKNEWENGSILLNPRILSDYECIS